MNSFISYAYALDSNYVANSSSYSLLLMFLIFLLIFYFMIVRPQRKKLKKHNELINSLKQGDEVLTTSGIIGKILKKTKSEWFWLSLNNNVEILIKSDFIVSVFPKGTFKDLQ